MNFVETELKLEVEPGAVERLKSLPSLQAILQGPPRSQQLRSVYFDTPALTLYHAGLSLRVRDDGDGHVQTVKTLAASRSSLFQRGEWEQRIAGDSPERKAATGSPLEPLIAHRKLRKSLRPIFETRVERTILDLADGKSEMRLAFDLGEVSADRGSVPVHELELELTQGDPSRLFALAKKLNAVAPLRLGAASKAERGYALLQDRQQPTPAKANSVDLKPEMSCSAAFQAICLSCLDHLLRNEPIFRQSGEPEALHQIRVAMRRLRAAIALFRTVAADDRRDKIDGQLRTIIHHLNAARDTDQFLAKVLRPTLRQHSGEPGLLDLDLYFARRRDQAFDRARQALDSKRFRHLILEIEEWVRTGRWLKSVGADQPVDRLAKRVLRARRRRVAKRGDHLERLSAAERHKVRIQAKTLRYGAQFFAGLWSGKKAAARRDKLLDALQRMQDDLGDFHDIVVSHDALVKLIETPPEDGEMSPTALGFAGGLVAGLQTPRLDALIAAACEDYKAFAGAKAFWR